MKKYLIIFKSFRKYAKAFLLGFLLLTACQKQEQKNNLITKNDYAVFFKIQHYKNYKKISVFNTTNQYQTYILCNKKENLPDSLIQKYLIIKTPVKTAVYLSTTFLGFIEKLDERSSVKGVDEGKYIYDSLLLEKYGQGKIAELGQVSAINTEKIIALKPDVVFVNDFDINVKNLRDKLKKFGIPVVFVREYRELHPLGRAEWIKFFSAFFDKEKTADSIFNEINKNYKKISDLKNKKNPGILVNIPFMGIWYLPGGKSFFAQFIKDAGGNYLWKNNNDYKSFTVSIEEVLSKKDSVDIWLNTGQANNLQEIRDAENHLYLLPVEKIKIYNNNKRTNPQGGNDFWESGVVSPDKILKDLYLIFNNDSIPPDSLYYYKPIH